MRNHVFPEGKANLWIMLKPAEIADGTKPIKLITAEDTRFFHCNIKTLNLIPSVMAAEKAKRAGAEECVFYRPGKRVTECAHSNCHIIKDGKVLFWLLYWRIWFEWSNGHPLLWILGRKLSVREGKLDY